MLAAGIDWQAVGAIAGGVATVFGIPLAVFAYVTARQAKRQAEPAEKMAKVAEADQRRATEPSLQIARWHGGFVAVSVNESEKMVYVYVESLRPVRAELGAPHLNGRLGRFITAQATEEEQAIVEFPLDAIEPDRSIQHEFSATVRVPESGRTGRFKATLYLQGGGWNAAAERVELD